MKYEATDDDLPDFFYDATKVPERSKVDPLKRAEIAVQAHYPAIHEKQRKREERLLRRAKREGNGLRDKKIYVKQAKKLQMWDWLLSLQTGQKFYGKEAIFCTELYDKFKKYTPYHVKWITENQFQFLKSIAAKYLRIPK